jgi:hypothetical protein
MLIKATEFEDKDIEQLHEKYFNPNPDDEENDDDNENQ